MLTTNKDIILYGCGSMSYRVMEILVNNNVMPAAVVDGNKSKIGSEYIYNDFKSTIMSYEEVVSSYSNYVIILTVSIGNAIEIKEHLLRLGEKNPIIHMQCPFKVDNTLLSDYKSVIYLSDEFEDEYSKKLFLDFLEYKASGNMEKLISYSNGDNYFDYEVIGNNSREVFVDVGCYTGDTIAQFLLYTSGYRKIIGLEADPGNYGKACQMIEYARLKECEIINKGGGARKKI